MKILHIISSLKIGGAESALYNFLSLCVNDGDEHWVLYFHDGPYRQKIEHLGFKCRGIKGLFHFYDPVALLYLIHFVRKNNPDVIHSALWSANILSRIIASILRIPLLNDLHGNSYDEGSLRNFFDRLTIQLPDKIVAVSPSVKTHFERNIIGARSLRLQKKVSKKLIVISNGIDPLLLRKKAAQNPLQREEFGIADTDFVIGAVGRLEPIKSYDLLLNAFATMLHKIDLSCYSPKLLIVGDGSQKISLETHAQKLNIASRTVFVGARTDAYRFFPLFDCFALSSQSEGLSIALLEALSFGLPIITTNTTFSHDVITDGVHGFVVPINSSQSLTHALINLITNPTLAATMKLNNYALVEHSYHLQTTVDAYHSCYFALTKEVEK